MCVKFTLLRPPPCIPPTPQTADIGAARKYQAAPCLGFRRRPRWLATMFTPGCYVWVFGESSRFLRQKCDVCFFGAGRDGLRLMLLPSASGRLLLLPFASSRLMVLPGASWRFLALPGASWCFFGRFLVLHSAPWRLLVLPGASWCFLVFLGTSCCSGAPACARAYARC